MVEFSYSALFFQRKEFGKFYLVLYTLQFSILCVSTAAVKAVILVSELYFHIIERIGKPQWSPANGIHTHEFQFEVLC